MFEYELTTACYNLLKALDVKPAESVAITCDTESNMDAVNAVAKAVVTLEGKPLMLKIPALNKGDKFPLKPFVATVRGCEVWVELNGVKVNGTEAYDQIMAAPAPRYACLGGLCNETLVEKLAYAEEVDKDFFKLAL